MAETPEEYVMGSKRLQWRLTPYEIQVHLESAGFPTSTAVLSAMPASQHLQLFLVPCRLGADGSDQVVTIQELKPE